MTRGIYMNYFMTMIIGVYFGIVLVKSEVASWFRVQSMFKLDEPHMFLIIGSAVIIGLISVQVIRRFNIYSLNSKTIAPPNKEFNKGTIIGGTLFGIGWATTGSCPGPIYAQIGYGELAAFSSLIGAICGASLYEIFRSRLPH